MRKQSAGKAGSGEARCEEDLSSKDIQIARESLKDAFKDAKGIFDMGQQNMPGLQRRIVELAQQRIQTFRDALSEFVAGYNQGTLEVWSCVRMSHPRFHPPLLVSLSFGS
jgi:hypothetical protein